MPIMEDAGRILAAISEFEDHPEDSRRGRYNLTGHGVQQGLKLQQNYDMNHDRINEAIQLLENNGYVNVRYGAGTSPFKFSGVEVTASGRAQYEQMKEKNMPSSGQKAEKTQNPNPKQVFVIHGRDERRRKAMFDFLRSIGLQPIEWSQARSMTGSANPYIGQILAAAFGRAQAVVALLTGDDEARLRLDLAPDGKAEPLTPQARPNVLFEAGMAMGSHEDRTVFVEIGHLRAFSDIAGRHTVRLMDPSDFPAAMTARQEIAARLKDAGCDVDLSGTDWHTAGSF